MIIGSFTGVLFMLTFKKSRQEIIKTIPSLGIQTFFIASTGEAIYILGSIFSLIALSLGYASLVSALSGLQNFFVFTYILILSLFIPNILKEELIKNIIILKTLAITLMFLGTWLITI